MGLLATRMLLDKDVEIVGAIARSETKHGLDLGVLAGMSPLGIQVDTDAERVLTSVRPDVVMLATQSFIPEIYDQLAMCIQAGANVLTISEEAFFPWSTSPTLTAQLDRLAKAHGVTVTGGGHQDSFWIHQVCALMGASHRIDSVEGFATWNADEYGADVIATKHVGETLEAFHRATERTDAPPTYGRNALGALAQANSLTPMSWQATVRPVVVDHDRPSRSLGRVLTAGTVIGYADVDTMHTAEGPVFTFEMARYVYGADEYDKNEWTIHGEPALHLSNGVVPSYTTTCTQWVNRLPDVVNARPGVVTVDEMPALSYRALPLDRYVHAGKLS